MRALMASKAGYILVVDDEEDIRDIVSEFLRDAGYACQSADNGAAGLALARSHPPVAIVSDCGMHPVSGPELVRELKRDACTAAIPVILMSGHSNDTVDGHGTAGFIQKPFQADELIALVRRATGD
jgi:DNA-binding response OmpR family regulator